MVILRPLVVVVCTALVAIASFEIFWTSSTSPGSAHPSTPTPLASAPLAPPVAICGNSKLLSGPDKAPRGAVRVPAGDNASIDFARDNSTYWFAPGVHLLGKGLFKQIIPSDGDTYIGAPGAVISGQRSNELAFTQHARNVTIEYLTIEDFGPVGSNQNEGVVNANSATDWTITHDTIENNAGAGVMLGTNDLLSDDCLTENEQYGFSSYTPSGPSNITITDDEISDNDTYNWEHVDPGCGCSGGGKLWDTHYATVSDNYVHDNHNVGIWADTDNVGIDITDNYISDNYGEGVMYEISYNGLIENNTFIHDGVGEGPTNPSFPTGAVYISESGSDPRVASRNANVFPIVGNRFINNWSGVILWENSDRFCGPDSPDNAGTLCTLVDPSVASTKTCGGTGIGTDPLFTDCRWRTVNVEVAHNTFTFSRSGVGNGCSRKNGCGFNGLFSEYGITAPYKAWVVPRDISNNQSNKFSDNKYQGPWMFMAAVQGTIVGAAKWTKGFTDSTNGSGIHFDGQDAGSTFSG